MPEMSETVSEKDTGSEETWKSSGTEDAGGGGRKEGGWGWFCVLGSFINHIITGGLERASGLLFLELEERWEGHSAAAISGIFSLNTALRQSLGPVVGILCNRFSCRTVVMAGGILSCVGLVLSAFPPVLAYLYFSYGTLTGVGFALAYAPSVVIVGLYFSKQRGKAIGIAASGVGVGAFGLPPLTEALLSFFGYFGTMLVLAGVGLHLVVGGALFRPLETSSPAWTKAESEIEPTQKSPVKEEEEKLTSSDLDDVTIEANDRSVAKESHGKDHQSCLKSFMLKYLNVYLLLDIPFLSFCVGMFLFSLAFQTSLVFLPALAKERGIPKDQSAILLSVMGGVEAVSRILAGVLFDRKKVIPVRLYIYNLDVALVALVTFLCTVVQTFSTFLVLGACYGLVTGMYISQKSVVIVDLVGQEVLSSSFGLLIWFQGMGSLIGPPVAGALRDSYQRYEEAFYFGGSVTLIAAVIMFVGNLVTSNKKRKARMTSRSS